MSFFDRWSRSRRRPSGPAGGRSSSRHRHRPTPPEPLEGRALPVIGAFSLAPIVRNDRAFDGVARLSLSPRITPAAVVCTGSLLRSGSHVLTAAHCVDDDGDRVADRPRYFVTFDMAMGRRVTMPVARSQVVIHPRWDGRIEEGADVAILRLPRIAPSRVTRYDIYRGSDELGQVHTIVGYGNSGTGPVGEVPGTAGRRRIGQNVWDEVEALANGPVLNSDFDDGTPGTNRIGDLGLGGSEAITGNGDSGGPAFLDGFQIAGMTSFGGLEFGEVDHLTRISAYQDFIDATVSQGVGSRRLVRRGGSEPVDTRAR